VMQEPAPIVISPTGGGTTTVQPAAVKSESKLANEDIAKQLNLKGGELPYRVTIDDNGQTYSATPGKNLVLMLGADYNWNIASSDDNILARRDVKLTDTRVQGVYQLVGAGKAVLSATGTCKSQSGCAAPTAKFNFNIESVISENETPEDLVK
jgi:hypothetical protein